MASSRSTPSRELTLEFQTVRSYSAIALYKDLNMGSGACASPANAGCAFSTTRGSNRGTTDVGTGSTRSVVVSGVVSTVTYELIPVAGIRRSYRKLAGSSRNVVGLCEPRGREI